MINDLMCHPSIVLQQVVLLRPGRFGNPLYYRLELWISGLLIQKIPFGEDKLSHQHFRQLIIRDVSELLAMRFWDDELEQGHVNIGFIVRAFVQQIGPVMKHCNAPHGLEPRAGYRGRRRSFHFQKA